MTCSRFSKKNNPHLLRGLRIESLEARNLLSAVTVTNGSDYFNLEDGAENITLRDAVYMVQSSEDAYKDIDSIEFADDLGNISVWGEDLTVSNANFDGLGISIEGGAELTLKNCVFTGDYTDNVITNNCGSLNIESCTFTDINVTVNTGRYDLEGIYGVVVNHGDLSISSTVFANATFKPETSRGDVNAIFSVVYSENNATFDDANSGNSIGNEYTPVGGNNGVQMKNASPALIRDTLIYGTSVDKSGVKTPATWDDAEVNVDVYGVAAAFSDVTLLNDTIVDTLGSYRGDYSIQNSIYNAETDLERGFILTEDGATNITFTNASELEAIYAFFDADTMTFENNDYRVWANAATVDAGTMSQYLGNLDVRQMERVNGEKVDIGAVESQAVGLTIVRPNAVLGEDPLTDITFLWNYTGTPTKFILKYTTSSEEPTEIPDGADTTTVVEITDLATLKHAIKAGQDTWGAFQVKAVGDNIDFTSSDWSEIAAVKTEKEVKLQAPTELVASLEKPTSMDLAWPLVTGATGYTLQYRPLSNKTETFFDPENEETLEDGWNDIDSSLFELTNYADCVLPGLAYNTKYQFRVKATGNASEFILDSDWVYASETTGLKLEPVTFTTSDRTTSSVTINWEDTKNDAKDVSEYVAQYQIAGSEAWISTNITVSGKSATVTDLPEGTTVNFRVMAKGVKRFSDDSDWAYTENGVKTQTTLAAPQISAKGTGLTTIKVTWNTVPNATGYTVSCGLDGQNYGESSYTEADGVVTAVITGLNPDTTYTVSVVANGSGDYVDSAPSTDDATTFRQLSTPNPTITNRTTASVTASWTAIPGATGYKVQVLVNGTEVVPTTATTNLSYTYTEGTDIAPAVNVQFNVTAVGNGSDIVDSEVGSTSGKTVERLVLNAGDLTAEGTSDTTIKVDWKKVENASGYVVSYRVKGSNAVYTAMPAGKDVNTMTLTGLTADTDYEITLKALGDGENFSDSNVLNDEASTWYKLAAPTLFSNGKTEASVSLEWQNYIDAAKAHGYTVQYSTDGENWTDVSSEDTAENVTDLTPATTYKFRVKALGTPESETVSSEWSEILEVTTKGILPAPELVLSNDGMFAIDVAWDKINGADSYLINWRKAGDTDWNSSTDVQFEGNYITFLCTDLIPDTTYEFQVKAVANGTNENFVSSEFSEIASLKTAAYLAAPIPTEVEDATTSNSITIEWDPVTDANAYDVVCKLGNTVVQTSPEQSGTTFTINGLKPNTAYTFEVTAKNTRTNRFSENAGTCTVTTDKAVMTKPVVTPSFVNEKIQVDWNEVTNAVSYKLWGGKVGEEMTLLYEGTDLTFTMPSYEGGVTYQFKVLAVGSETTYDAWSEIATITAPDSVRLESVVVRNLSEAGANKMPTSLEWADEWMTVFVEVWTQDTEGLLPGRSFTFTFEADPDLYTIEGMNGMEGFTLTHNNDGSWTITVAEGFEAGTGDTFFGYFKLTPIDENGVNWTDVVNQDAVEFNADGILDVYAVPGDLNDDGKILIAGDGADNTLFDTEYQTKKQSYADFDGNEKVTLQDRKWMIDNNEGKTFWDEEYDVTYPENFPYSIAPVVRAIVAAKAEAAALSEISPAMESPLAYADVVGEAVKELASEEADPIPVVKDENTITDNAADLQKLPAAQNLEVVLNEKKEYGITG